MRLAAGVLLVLMLAGSAQAADDPAYLYRVGRYDEAIKAGEALQSAEGHAIAAHAAMADAMLRAEPCLDCLRRAEDLARAAIASDPKRADGYVFLAAALGYRGRIEGKIIAQWRGYPETAKKALEDALVLEPDNARALAALAGWNIEVVRAGGATLARWMYGASLDRGFELFDRALKRAPGDVTLRLQYALTLAGFDARTYRQEIGDALRACVSGNAATSYDRVSQDRARALLAVIQDRDKFAWLVRRDQGYP